LVESCAAVGRLTKLNTLNEQNELHRIPRAVEKKQIGFVRPLLAVARLATEKNRIGQSGGRG
jgi:hypothetical protein